MTTEALTIHPIANEFPEFAREDFEALKADIQANGLQIPIELYKGQILDGRNRYRACRELGIEPKLQAYDGHDPLGHAISLNVIRRQLSTIDKAQLALLIKPKFEEAAAERVKAAQPKPGENVLQKKANQAKAPVPEPKNQALKGQARDQAAKAVGVSGRTVENVALITKQAPALIPEIKAGLLTIPQAVDKINAQEALKRKQETLRRQQEARDAGREDTTDKQAQVEAAKERIRQEEALEWGRLNKVLDVAYNLRLIEPVTAARLVPAAATKRVLRLLQDVSAWCDEVAQKLAFPTREG
jgi:ParB-like chromosome segregation protein Spo0J